MKNLARRTPWVWLEDFKIVKKLSMIFVFSFFFYIIVALDKKKRRQKEMNFVYGHAGFKTKCVFS